MEGRTHSTNNMSCIMPKPTYIHIVTCQVHPVLVKMGQMYGPFLFNVTGGGSSDFTVTELL